MTGGERVQVLCPTHVAKTQFRMRLPEHKLLDVTTGASFLTQYHVVDKASGRSYTSCLIRSRRIFCQTTGTTSESPLRSPHRLSRCWHEPVSSPITAER